MSNSKIVDEPCSLDKESMLDKSSDPNEFMENVCRLMCEENSINKFHLCDLFRSTIDLFTKEQIVQSQWMKKLRDELFLMFKNRLNDELRKPMLSLTAELTLKCQGLDWMKLDKWNFDGNSKFFLLLLKLISIEIEMILMDCFNQKSNYDKEELLQKYAQCLIIFENLFLTLIKNVDIQHEDDRIKLNADEIIGSVKTIKETFLKMITFLKELSSYAEYQNYHQMAIASIRMICLYMSEESDDESLQKEIEQITPFVRKLLLNCSQNEPKIDQSICNEILQRFQEY